MKTYRLPIKHALDWYQRCGDDYYPDDASIVAISARWIQLRLSPYAVDDLLADAKFYVECMGPADTGDLDYRPAARTCLRWLADQGVDRARQ